MRPKGKTVRLTAWAMADQLMWSGSFFLFSTVLAICSSAAEYSTFAIDTALALIVIAITRGAAVESPLLIPGIPHIGHQVAICRGYLLAAAVATIAAGVALQTGLNQSNPTSSLAWLLVPCLVLQDGVRYRRLIQGSVVSSARLSALYFAVGLATFALGSVIFSKRPALVLIIWVLTCAVFSMDVMGTALRRRTKALRHVLNQFTVTLGLEGLYTALAAQASILLLGFLHAAIPITGFRLAYSMCFAPAGMVLQGLHPHVFRRMVQVRETSHGHSTVATYAAAWAGGGVLLYAISYGGANLAFHLITTGTIHLASAYIMPVGAALVGGGVLGAALLAARFYMSGPALHHWRIATLLADIGLQIAGISLGGVSGLITSLYIGAAVKAMLGLVLLGRWGVRHERSTYRPLGASDQTPAKFAGPLKRPEFGR